MLAVRLRKVTRVSDVTARLGGGEFVVVLEDIHGAEDAIRIAEKLVQELACQVEGGLHISASIGIVLSSEQQITDDVFLRQADKAIYKAKLAGFAVPVAIQLILSLLITDVGFSFVEPTNPGSTPIAKAFGIEAALWWIVSCIFSLTAGTIIAVLSSGEITRCRGAFLGILIWAFGTIAGACVFTNLAAGAFKTTVGAFGVPCSGAVASGALLTTNGHRGELS